MLQFFVQTRLLGQTQHWKDLVFQASDWLFLGLLSPLVFLLGNRFPLSGRHPRRLVTIHILGSLSLCLGWASLGMLMGLLLHVFPAQGSFGRAYVNWILISLPCDIFDPIAQFGSTRSGG